jgi:hypothetical protein
MAEKPVGVRLLEAQVEKHRADAERLRMALERIAETPTGCVADHSRIARAALDREGGDGE